MKKGKMKSMSASELSRATGVPLKRVEEIVAEPITLEEISSLTGIPLDVIRRRAKEENWGYIETTEIVH